jgi:hypothetical protein
MGVIPYTTVEAALVTKEIAWSGNIESTPQPTRSAAGTSPLTALPRRDVVALVSPAEACDLRLTDRPRTTAELGMALTNREVRAALERGRRRRLMRSGKRRWLEAIDRYLNRLEEMHVRGTQISRRDGCRKMIAGLLEEVGKVAPESVKTARNSYDLHSALLDWQSVALDAIVAGRRQRFPDLNLETDHWPRPRRRRVRRSSDSGHLDAA